MMSDRDMLERISKRVDEMHVVLLGNGTPERGLVIRVDRLEQRENLRPCEKHADSLAAIPAIKAFIANVRKFAWLIIGLLVTTLGTAIVAAAAGRLTIGR
jgi:hypothetical protein